MTSRTLWKRILGSALLIGALSTQAAHAAGVVQLVATPDPASVGSPLTIDVSVTGIADLYAYQFTLAFDPTLLQVVGITEGSFLSGGGSTFFDGGTIDNALGTISFAFGSLVGAVPGVSGGGLLEHIAFAPIKAGSSALTFSDALFLDANLGDIAVQTVGRDLRIIGVTAVPEPETFAMLGLGLGVIAALRRRRVA